MAPQAAAPAEGTIAERLRAALAELRDAGYDPSLVVIPMGWRLFQALELDPAPHRGGEAIPPAWVPAESERGGFIGLADGVPVIEQQHADDRIVAFDPGRFARFKERNVEDPTGSVSVEIRAYDEDGAREIVCENRVNFDEGLDEDARVRMLQQWVLFTAVYPFEVDVVDA